MRATTVLRLATMAVAVYASAVPRGDHGDDSEECEDDGDWITTSSHVPTYTYTSSHTPVPTTTSWSTSTIYSTTVYTITSCPPTVHDCPAGGSVTTEIVPIGTTICPITTTEDWGSEPTPDTPDSPEETGYHPIPGSSTAVTVPEPTPDTPSPPTVPIGSAGRVAAGGLLGGVIAVMALVF